MKKISIIIPVYNNLNLTLQCINSILKHCQNSNYEIIVSDDASIDETRNFFKDQEEIIYRRNSTNKGFAYTCNRGAEVATGEYLLFLNNDTILTDNILNNFLDTFNKNRKAGIVGAKLLYENNTIQHSGVLIYPNKNVGHLFQFFPSNYPDANKLRKLQAVTGACLAIPKKLFFKAGKFDENFINGFEDLDLCFRIKYDFKEEIIYNPKISLFHLEEQTRKDKDNDKNAYLLHSKWFSKISGDFYITSEGYDYKLNDIGDFYIIKEKFENLPANNNNNIKDIENFIKNEPLFFDGYKKVINHYISEKKYTTALQAAKMLFNFEPVIANLYFLHYIYTLLGDNLLKEKADIIIKNFEKEKSEFSQKIKFLIEKLLKEKRVKECSYYIEWLSEYDSILEYRDLVSKYYNDYEKVIS